MGPAGNEAWYVTDGVGGFTAHQEFDANGQAIDRDGNGMADWIAPDNDLTVNSSISTTWFVEEQYRNSSLLVTAAGQESGAVATQVFTDANINTIIVVGSSTATSTYGDSVIFGATVAALTGSNPPTGTVGFFDGSTLLGIDSVASPGLSPGTSFYSITVSNLTAGTHAIHAFFLGGIAGVDSFNNSISGDITQTVSKADTFITVASSVATSTYGDSVIFGAGVAALTGFEQPTGTVGFFDGATLLGIDSVGSPGFQPWERFYSITVSNLTAGTHAIHAVFLGGIAGAGNFNDSISANITQTVNKADATISVIDYIGVYDGAAHTSSVTATGVGGVVLNSVSGTPHTNAGIYSDSWTFTGGANYNDQSGIVTTTIAAKGITGSFTVANKTYDATTAATVQTRTLAGVLAGDVGNVSLIGGTATFANANAGIGKLVTLTGATLTGTAAGNYSLTSVNTTTANITLKEITVSLTVDNKVYDGTTAATGVITTLTGVIAPGDVNLTGGLGIFDTANAGTGKTVTLVGAIFSGTAASNYTLLSPTITTTADITKADATLTVTGYFVTYDGNAHTATATVTGVGGENLSAGLTLSGTTHTNAGTYTDTVTFTDVTGNYKNATKFVKDYITKAAPTLTATSYLVTYDGNAHEVQGTATGVKGESLSGVTGTLRTHAGTYTDAVTYTDVTGNYKNGTKFVKDFIAKANVTLTVTAFNVVYDGNVHQAQGTATGVKGESLSGVTGSLRTNAGTYTDLVFYTDTTGNYRNVGKFVTDFISKATVTLTVTGYAVRFDGAAHTATATGVGGVVLSGVNVSATTHTAIGTYTDTVTFTDVTGNYKPASKLVKNFIL